MKTSEFDRRFDAGEDVTDALDLSRAQRGPAFPHRVYVGLPSWMIEALDRESRRLGVSRQSVIRAWIAERLEHPPTTD